MTLFLKHDTLDTDPWALILVFGLNTEIYGVNLRIQSEYWKIQTRKNSIFGHFSRSEKY